MMREIGLLKRVKESKQRSWGLKKAGFTLIELLIVLVILSILMYVFYAKLKGREASAKLTAAEAYVMRAWEAARTWKTNNGYLNYASFSGWNTLINAGLAENQDKITPFGTTSTLAHTADNLGITITFDITAEDPAAFCQQLATRFQQHGYSASCSGGTITVTLKD